MEKWESQIPVLISQISQIGISKPDMAYRKPDLAYISQIWLNPATVQVNHHKVAGFKSG